MPRKLKKLISHFRILKDWKIGWNSKAEYKAQCVINVDTREAIIYAYGRRNVPEDYYVHEILHIALSAFKSTRRKRKEIEEQLVEDICVLIHPRIVLEKDK